MKKIRVKKEVEDGIRNKFYDIIEESKSTKGGGNHDFR